MKRALFFLIISLIFNIFAVVAQQQAKYVVWFTNGSSIECLGFENTEDGNLQVLRTDGKTAIYSMDVVDRISIAARTATKGVASQSKPSDSQQAYPGYRQSQGDNAVKQMTSGRIYAGEYEWVRVVPWKNPFVAGLSSAIIPGLGQFYNGQVGLGFAFMGSWLAMGAGAYIFFSDGDLWPVGAVFAGAAAASWVWSILHASDTSKRINAQRGYALGNGKYLRVEPVVLNARNLAFSGHNYGYGLGVSLVF